MRCVGLTVLTVLSVLSEPPAARASDCPAQAAGNADFVISDTDGRPVAEARLSFTATNWDSILVLSSDDAGNVSVPCVPAQEGYDVTVMKRGYAVSHVTADASLQPKVFRVILIPATDRHVQVTYRGDAIPGATVKVTDSDGTVQTLTTDQEGRAVFQALTARADATIDVSLTGFVSQRAAVPFEFKNDSIVFDIRLAPVCKPIVVR